MLKLFPRTSIFFALLISLMASLASGTHQSSSPKGSSLSVGDDSDILVSPGKTFTCGFYMVGEKAYTFSIWFSNSANKTVVWTANCDRPVNGHGSEIALSKGGVMTLTDVDGRNVWSSNISSTEANVAELLDNGNLILIDPKGNLLWQGFDFPTDTLLPTQPITKSTQLVSATARGMLSSGYYSFFFDNNIVLTLLYDGPEVSDIYWPDPGAPNVFAAGRTAYNSTRYGVLDDKGQFVSSDQLSFSASDLGYGIIRRLTLDYDGNLRLYSLNQSTGMWSVSWEALPQLCQIHGLCGICIYSPRPMCSCPPGCEMSDASDWSRGCKPMFNISCDRWKQLEFVELQRTDFWGYDINYTPSLGLEDCRKLCRDECTCRTFEYIPGIGTG